MSGAAAALAACRAVTTITAMGLWGCSAYLAALVPVRLRGALWSRARRTSRWGAALLLLATLAALPCLVANIGNGWGDAGDPELLRAVLLHTDAGYAWVVEAMLAAGLLAVTVTARLAPWGMAGVSGLLLASVALTGHAAMDVGARGLWHRGNDILHLWAGGAWLGALLPLLPILRALDDPALRGEAGLALRRFSVAGHGAVALVLATGAVNTGLVLGRWPTDMASTYQLLLCVKVALVLAMTALAVVNRYGLVPRMAGPQGPGAVRALRGATVAEVLLGCGAISLVAVFGLLDPG